MLTPETHSKNIPHKREFDALKVSVHSRIRVKRAKFDDLPYACQLGNDEIPGGVAAVPLIQKICSHNSDSAYIFWRKDRIVGFYAMLMLNPIGLERLLLGEFDGASPQTICLARTKEKPAAIYKWAVLGPGLAAEGIKHISQILRQPQYQNVNFFSRPNTETGVRINLNLGFRPINCGTSGLYRYTRIVNSASNMQRAA